MKKNNNKITIPRVFLFVSLIVLSFIYALPNFYNKNPSVVIVPKVETVKIELAENVIDNLKINNDIKSKDIKLINNELIITFKSINSQMKGYEKIREAINNDKFYTNLTLTPSSPKWLDMFNAKSTSLGLDLMGGVHFLMEVDVEDVQQKTLIKYRKLINNKIIKNFEGATIKTVGDELIIIPNSPEIEKHLNDYIHIFEINNDDEKIVLKFSQYFSNKISENAVKQNILTLKNRVNEIGVAEPVVQREGKTRIVVQLPGIQDTEKAKSIIGTTASLVFKQLKGDGESNIETIDVPDYNDNVIYTFHKGSILTGSSIIDANSGFDPESRTPLVSVELDSEGGEIMFDYTTKNKGVFIGSILNETLYNNSVDENGNVITTKTTTTKAINVARIQGAFSNRFQITGIENKHEAHQLAILLRSGSLAAPINIIEERTIGPNMGAENIEKGKISILIGFLLVLILMVYRYKKLGLIANVCVTVNLLLLLSILSFIGATLTLPGIAGIILTVGMAVDGNVVIFERIKEEYKIKANLVKAIENGYAKAFSSIVAANVTTFIAAVILFIFGTGPVKGFAITLSIGIFTSLITSIYLSKFFVDIVYRNKKELNI